MLTTDVIWPLRYCILRNMIAARDRGNVKKESMKEILEQTVGEMQQNAQFMEGLENKVLIKR